MDRKEFVNKVLTGNRDDYVSDEVLEFFEDTASFRVEDKSALEKDEISQTEFVSVAFLESADNFSDEELIDRVRNKLTGENSSDIQKYQLRDGGRAPNTVSIWRHGNGYSAFALHE